MSRGKRIDPSEGSWRDIRQSSSRRAVSKHAWRRKWWLVAKGLMALALLAALGAGGWLAYERYQDGVEPLRTVRSVQPLKEIVYQTDGVLTREWVRERLGIKLGDDVMGFDIHAMKTELESLGQVKSASLRRQPERLVIQLRERLPVARVRVREEGAVRTLLVDREGVVYYGQGYRVGELDRLPFLAGVSLRRAGDGYAALPHMDVVADLLRAANEHTPHLMEGWRVVDGSELPELLTVRDRDIEEIVFARERMEAQLRRLDMIVAENRRQMTGQRRVDLSLGNQVVVR